MSPIISSKHKILNSKKKHFSNIKGCKKKNRRKISYFRAIMSKLFQEEIYKL